MTDVKVLQKEIEVIRRELKNMRQEIIKSKVGIKSDIEGVKKLLFVNHQPKKQKETETNPEKMCFPMVPIGTISSCFKSKNGIPRQSSLCLSAKATLEINKTVFTNPEHSLIGLEEFCYIWVLFVFHKNGPESTVKAKVHPPRLDGASVGVFSSRSPHRPCAIGLSLVKLDKILGNKLYLSGVDLLDGTPVLDIKPYIGSYDCPKQYGNMIDADNKEKSLYDKDLNTGLKIGSEPIFSDANLYDRFKISEDEDTQRHLPAINEMSFKDSINSCTETKNFNLCTKTLVNLKDNSSLKPISIGNLLNEPIQELNVVFTVRAEADIEKFHPPNHTPSCGYCLDFIDGVIEAKKAVVEILQNDPRSVYRRKKCSDKLYFFEIDTMHVTCWFEDTTSEILRVNPVNNRISKSPK